jgi:protocatechuate 3,4-dioxygenase beta subunit
VIAIVLALLAATAGQPPPPREMVTPPRATAVLSGTVVTDDLDARPVRHARVTCSSPQLRSDITAVTDDRGRFTFAALPAGRYTIRTTKAGWVATMYGAKRPLRAGVPIALADGETVEIVARLPRGAVITGTVLDENGQPSVNTAVRAMRFTMHDGERRLLTFGASGTTDDRGMYRIYGLPAGEYIVGTAARSTSPAPAASLVRLTSEHDVAHARTAAAGVPPPPPRRVAFTSTFFPGTPFAAQAARLTLGAGEEREGIDFALRLVATARVEGSVFSPDGVIPPGTQVTLLASGDTSFPDVPLDGLRTSFTAADGTFAFSGVSPGEYTLLARSPSPNRWASTTVLVDGEQVSGLSLALQSGLTLSGRVSFAGDGAGRAPDMRSIRVALRPVQREGTVSIAPPEAAPDAEGRFSLDGIMPGRYVLHASFPGAGRPGGWHLRAAAIGRQDTLDVPVVLQPGGPVPDAAILFTDRSSAVTGTLQHVAAGAPSDYTIVLFPADQSLWSAKSRRIRGISPAAEGTYAFRNLPAGDYLIAVADDVEAGEWFDPAFLQRIAPGAIRITIGESEQRTVNLSALRTEPPSLPAPK